MKRISLLIVYFFCMKAFCFGQTQKDTLLLTMFDAIRIAQKSSLQSLVAENSLLVSSWRFKNFKSSNLPSIGLSVQPFTYNRSINEQFDPSENTYGFFETQNLNSFAQLSINQNLIRSGGKLALNTNLNRLENFGDLSSTQFSATQINLGLSQPLFAFNEFKWDRVLEPLAYKQAKLKYVKSAEEIALSTLVYYFNMLRADLELKIAKTNMLNADTLYQLGKKRSKITTIQKSDLLNLRLEYLNSKSAYAQAKNGFNQATVGLKNFINIKSNLKVTFRLLEDVPQLNILPRLAIEKAQVYNPDYLNFEKQILQSKSSVEQSKKENRFQATLNASVGLNQHGVDFIGAYRYPLDQQQFNLSLYIPILDWGLRKGRYELAKKQEEVLLLSVKQQESNMQQEIVNKVLDFNLKFDVLQNTKEAATIALEAYGISKHRFIQGLLDVNTLVIQQEKKDNAQIKYITELKSFWNSYFFIRSITLFDFEHNISLVDKMNVILK